MTQNDAERSSKRHAAARKLVSWGRNDEWIWYRGGEWEWALETEAQRLGGDATGAYPDGGTYVLTPKSVDGIEPYEPEGVRDELQGRFLALGDSTWELMEGRLIGKFGFGKQPFPDGLADEILAFTKDFGPLVSPRFFGPVAEPEKELYLWRRGGHAVLRQAQLLWLVHNYGLVISSSDDASLVLLRSLVTAALDQLVSEDSAWDEIPHLADLGNDEMLLFAAAELIESLSHDADGLSGLRLRYLPKFIDEDVVWDGGVFFDNLVNLIWHWAFKDLKESSPLAICANENCPRPGRLMPRGRPNRKYCRDKCRAAQISREWRGRNPGKRRKQD